MAHKPCDLLRISSVVSLEGRSNNRLFTATQYSLGTGDMWVGGGAASAQRGRGGGVARVPRESFAGERMQHAPSVEMDPLKAFDGKEFGRNAFLHPSLMPLHIVADPGTSAPFPSILGCYLPDLDSASISSISSPSNCYIHIKDPSIRTLRNGDVWTVVIQNTVVARWVQAPDHLNYSTRMDAAPVPAAPAQLCEQELGELSLPQDPASVDFFSHVSDDPSRLLTAQPPGPVMDVLPRARPIEKPSFGMCNSCGKPAELLCSKCKIVCYCSLPCQKKHWSEHKLKCGARKGEKMQHVDADDSGDGQISGANAAFHSMLSQLPSAIHMRTLKSEIFVNVLSENGPDADFSLVSGIRVCFAPLYVQINKAKTIRNEGDAASQNSKPTAAPFAPPGFFPASPFASVPPRTTSLPTHHSQESQSDANEQLQGHTGIFMASNESCNGLPVYFSYPEIADHNPQAFFSMRLSLGETVLVKRLCDRRGKKMAPSGKQTSILPARTLQPAFSFAEAKLGNFEVQGSQMSNVGGGGQLLWLLEERTFRPQESPHCKTIACCLTTTSSLGSCVEISLRAKNAWMQVAESSVLPPQSTVALSSQLPWIVSVSGSKGQRSFALNGQFLIHKVSFKYGFIRYRKMASHSVFLDYGIDIQQWIAHFRFQPSAYCHQQCNSGSGIRNPQVSSQAVTYVCDSLPSFGDIAPSKVHGICGKCALKLLKADCSFLPALIASSSPSAENIDNEKKFLVAVPVEWSAVTAVGNIDLEFSSGEAFGGDDGAWDPFGMGGFRGGFQGPGFRGRGGRGRMMRGRGRGRGNRGGRGHNLGFGLRNTSEAAGETAMRVPLPPHTASEGAALDVSNLVVTFLGALPHDAWSGLNSSKWCEFNLSPTQFSPIDCHKPPSEAFSEHDSSNLGVCILPSLLASARCFETISKNQGLLSEFITQTATSHGSTESALINFVTLCSLANGRFSDLLASPVIGEHVFLSMITSVKRWSRHLDYTGNQDSVLSSCVPVSSAIKQLVQRMLSQSSFVQFPFRSCKVKYRDSDSDSQLEREGIVLSWTAAGELDVECEHPHRGSYERISESWITGTFLPNRPPIFPRVCGLLLQCFVYEMQRYISPITQIFIDRCSGVSDFRSDSDYIMRLFSASIAVLIARNTFDIGADVIAENLHPCAVISECSQCFLCEFEVASKDSNQSHGTTGSSEPPRLEISSSRVFFHHSIPQIVHSATLCGARSSVSSAKTAISCHEVLRWSLVNVNAGESAWAVFLVPCALKSTEATDIISSSGTLGLNFGLPNCSLTPIEIEYGQVVTVQVDASKCEVVFVVNNRLVSTMSVPADKFPLHLATAGCNSAFICILREPVSCIPAASFNCMLENNSSVPFQVNSAASLMHFFQVLENDSHTGFALARCLCWLRKAASSSLNFALDFSIQIPSVSLFFIVRDIAASLPPVASEYFKSLHIVSEKLHGVLSPGVPRFSDRTEKPPLQIINALHEHLMKALTTSIIRIQDLLSLVDLHKNGKFKKFLFATLFQECVFPAIHSCIRQYLFEEVRMPSSLQTLSDISPDSQSTLDGMLSTMFAGPEQDIFSDKLHLPLHTIVADAVRHHVKCASKRRVWTMKVVDDNFSMESSRVCEAKDLNGIVLFSIDIQSPPSPEDLAFQGDYSTPEFSLHFVVTHDNKSSRKTIKMRSVSNSELSISVDPFGVSFTLGQNKTDVEFKALGLAALISTVSFPLTHLCNSLEQPSVDVSRFSLAPKWVLKLALRSIDYITLDFDTLSLIRDLPRLVLDHFETVCLIPSTCSFFHSSVQFIISKIFKKRLNILDRDPVANNVFSQHLKSFVSRALASLQWETVDDRRDHWQDFFTAYSALAHASDSCFLSSYVHTSSRTTFVNEWTCLKRNDSSLIVHVSKPYSAVISTDVYPNVHEDGDNFNPFHPPSKQIQESVTRLCHCSFPLPTGTSVINVKICSSLQDRASFGLIFPTFQGDCTIGSTSDSWGILCSGAIQHKGERRDFLSIVSGCIITLVYVSHSGSLTVSINNEVVHVFCDLPSHSLRFAATLGNSVTEATLFEVDFMQSCLYPPIYHEGITSACTALREHCTTLKSCLDTIARIRHFSDSLLVIDNSKRLPLSLILLCAESVTCECLAQHRTLPSNLTPTQYIDVAVLMSTFDHKLEAFVKKCCANAAVSNEVLRCFMRCHLMTSSADVPLPSAMAHVVVSIAVDQISSFSGDESSNFRDRARTIIVEMILSFLDLKTELGIEFPYVGSTLSLKSTPDAALVKPASFVEDDHSQSFFPFSEELAGKIDAIVMARSLYSFVEEQIPQALAYVVPNFFVMVLLSVKKRFSKKQITNQISATLDISASELSRLIVTVECFLRTWEMNDCKIDFGAGMDILGNHQGRQRQRELAFGFAGRPNWTRDRRGRRQLEGDSDFQKEEKNELGHPVSLRNEWSSCALAPLEVGSVVCTSENFCLVQGPFSRRVLYFDQVKVIQANKSPFFADSASCRAFLLKSNMVSSLTSAVTQRCLVVLPAQLKLHVSQHLQSLAENAVCSLVLSSGIDASRFGIKLAADVPLFDQQVVEDALTAALNLATIRLSSEFSFSSRIPASSAKIFAISRLLYAYDYLDKNECFPENESSLADMFTGLQIIKKFLFQRFSQELKVDPKVLIPLMRDPLFNLYSSSVSRAIRSANIAFDRRVFISQFFRTVLCGDPELNVNVASIAADFLSKTCVPGSFVASKQAALELVDCLSAFANSNSSIVEVPVQSWVLDSLMPDALVPSYAAVGSEMKLCFPHCGWCDIQLGDGRSLRMSPACGLVLDCIAGAPSSAADICQRTRLSLHVINDAVLHLQDESLITCDAGSFYHILPRVDHHETCINSLLKFIGHGRPTPRLLPLGKEFVSIVAEIAMQFRSSKFVEEVHMFHKLAVQGFSASNISFALSEMIAVGAIFRVGSILIDNLEHLADASQLHNQTIKKLAIPGNSGTRNQSFITKLVLITPPASISVPPFPPTSSMFSGFSLDSQQMEDLAAESLFAVAEHARVDVLDVANSLLIGQDGNFISALINSCKNSPHDVVFSPDAAAASAERCPIGLCTPSSCYTPLLLPCGHGACSECWQFLLEHALKTSSTPVVRSGEDTSGMRSVNCIKCPADFSNKCTYKMKLTDVQSCVPQLASSFSNSIKRWFNRTITSGSFPVAACSCGASVFSRSMDSEVECQCGRTATVGDIKLGSSAQHWRSHPFSSCNSEHEWRLLSTYGSSERIALMRTKKCPGCMIDTTKCGCDASNVICNGLDRCPNEACNHLICQKCKLDWCWICRKPGCHGCDQSSNSSDLKERFNEGSTVVSKLDAALIPSYISRFVLDDSQGGAVKIISVLPGDQPCSIPLNAGDVFCSINGIAVHSIADLMKAALSEHAVDASILITYRRRGKLHSVLYNCEALPTGFSADAIVFKRSLYIHNIIRPQAQSLPPMQRLQRLCDAFVSLHSKAVSQKKDRKAGSLNLVINAANSGNLMQYALQFQQELTADEAALMMFLREPSPE